MCRSGGPRDHEHHVVGGHLDDLKAREPRDRSHAGREIRLRPGAEDTVDWSLEAQVIDDGMHPRNDSAASVGVLMPMQFR